MADNLNEFRVDLVNEASIHSLIKGKQGVLKYDRNMDKQENMIYQGYLLLQESVIAISCY